MMVKMPEYVFIDDSTLTRSYVDNILRSQTESGPMKTRPIQNVPMFQVSFTARIHSSRFAEFNNWFKYTVGFGAYFFLMRDPFDGTERRFRFSEASFSWAKTGNLMSTNFVLEAYDDV